MPVTSPVLMAQLRATIKKHNLDDLASYIIENAAECYAMDIAGPEDYAKTGNTRFGGDPDLPVSIPWPCTGDPDDPGSRFANFIAQINFADLPPLRGYPESHFPCFQA